MELKVIEDSEIIIPAERVVIAFGFKPNALSWLNDYQVKTDQSGRIIAKGANKHPFKQVMIRYSQAVISGAALI